MWGYPTFKLTYGHPLYVRLGKGRIKPFLLSIFEVIGCRIHSFYMFKFCDIRIVFVTLPTLKWSPAETVYTFGWWVNKALFFRFYLILLVAAVIP